MAASPELPQLVEHHFRRHYGRLVAGLTKVFGSARLDLVEDVVQEALLRAVKIWPFEGVPERPAAWLNRVARNLAIDRLRHQRVADEGVELLAREAAADPSSPPEADEIRDDSLRMIFTCCHPALPVDARIPLTLKTLCGFGVREIAAALLLPEGTVAQRLTRAKARLQREMPGFEVPGPAELPVRLESVLQVLYLMFNEGYRAHAGEQLVREELVHEAMRLAALLLEMPETRRPEVHALLALMCFCGARLPARSGEAGEVLTMAQQDRSRWDQEWVRCGFAQFQASIGGPILSVYHVEAAIASVHALARSYAETDWAAILKNYDFLARLQVSPVASLNRVVALSKVEGLRAGLDALAELEEEGTLARYPLFHSLKAQLEWAAGARDRAGQAFARALELPLTDPERRLLEHRRAACAAGEAPPGF